MWSAEPIVFAKVSDLDVGGVQGWAVVQAAKAHFHDQSRAQRPAYVVNGDLVTLERIDQDTTDPSASGEGWAEVDFTNDAGKKTSGWPKLEELAIPQ